MSFRFRGHQGQEIEDLRWDLTHSPFVSLWQPNPKNLIPSHCICWTWPRDRSQAEQVNWLSTVLLVLIPPFILNSVHQRQLVQIEQWLHKGPDFVKTWLPLHQSHQSPTWPSPQNISSIHPQPSSLVRCVLWLEPVCPCLPAANTYGTIHNRINKETLCAFFSLFPSTPSSVGSLWSFRIPHFFSSPFETFTKPTSFTAF